MIKDFVDKVKYNNLKYYEDFRSFIEVNQQQIELLMIIFKYLNDKEIEFDILAKGLFDEKKERIK